MATYYFVNGNGDWANTGNWSATRGGASGAGPPTSGDTVYIEQGNTNLYTSASVTGLTAVYVTASYTGAFGTSAAPVQVAGTTLLLQHTGGAYITGASWTTVRCSSPSAQPFIFAGSGTIGTMNCGSTGNIIIGASQTVTTTNSAGARVDYQAGAGTATTITTAGTASLARSIATLNVKAGASVTQTGSSSAVSTAVYIESGGTFNSIAGGTITLLTIYPGGIFQAALNPYPLTITNRSAWVGSGYSSKTSAGDITFTNPPADIPV